MSVYPAGLELVKWLAFAAMVVDHIDLVLLERSAPWMYQVGRFAFPAFALAFGIGLAHSRDLLSVASRLLWPGVVAQVAWAFIDPTHPANVLIGFFCCALGLLAWQTWRPAGLAALALLLLTSSGLEGGKGMLLLVGGGYLGVCISHANTLGRVAVHAAAAAPWLLLFPSPGLLAGLGAPHAARWLPTLPRWSKTLPWAYAGHLWALFALRFI